FAIARRLRVSLLRSLVSQLGNGDIAAERNGGEAELSLPEGAEHDAPLAWTKTDGENWCLETEQTSGQPVTGFVHSDQGTKAQNHERDAQYHENGHRDFPLSDRCRHPEVGAGSIAVSSRATPAATSAAARRVQAATTGGAQLAEMHLIHDQVYFF